ncbi:MAG: hypothetical protein V1926_01350 [Candidatus Peregrinibacteria bacterium]
MRFPLSVGLAVLLTLAFVPLASAKAPPPITGLGAEMVDGALKVSWSAPSEGAAFYRVYFSAKSILENAGLYDDFETTTGPETEYTFAELPDVPVLYIAVLGVSAENEDANTFVEEVAVPLPKSAPAPTTPEPTPTPLEVQEETVALPQTPVSSPPEEIIASSSASSEAAKTVSLAAVNVTSATGIVLTFTSPLLVEASRAPEAFSITDSSGFLLPIRRIVIENAQITVETEMQEQNRLYTLRVSEPAYSPTGLPLDPVNRSSFFQGHPEGRLPSEPLPINPVTDVQPVQGLVNFLMEALPEANGLTTVKATWELDGDPRDLFHYLVTQSSDGGKTFSDPTILENVGGITVRGIPPGTFGLSITPIRIDGTQAAGVFRSITVGTVAPPPAPVPTASITSQAKGPTTPASPLSTTGAASMLITFIALGAAAGYRRAKAKCIVQV